MRLRTKLALAAMALTCAIVLVLSFLFVAELLGQRIEQTSENNEVLSRQVLNQTRQAVETGLRQNPPVDRSDEALGDAVTDALRSQQSLSDLMGAIVRYSPPVQDVSVTDSHGSVLVSTDPEMMNQQMPYRVSLSHVRDGGLLYQIRQVFGRPAVLDITQALNRNGTPFLAVHLGIRSTFLKNSYEPWLRKVLELLLLAALAAMIAAGLLANLALRPIEQISKQLETLALQAGTEVPAPQSEAGEATNDAVVRVTKTIGRLGEQMRSQEAGYSALQANLTQMLDTLRDGVLLFTADRRAVMVSDAVAHFLSRMDSLSDVDGQLVGKRLEEIFAPETALGAAVLEAFASNEPVEAKTVVLEDGRRVQISLDRIDDGKSINAPGSGSMGTLLTLRDTESAMQLGQELEVSRRLGAIGRLTAGVGHEVKNPINAMVVHLELLRAKLSGNGAEPSGAQRHVDILAGEMQRLDRVVQTLADFSRPMEMHLQEHDMRKVVGAVIELTAAEMAENGVQVRMDAPADPIPVRVDAEQLQQALLNLLLNGMQAMPGGGAMRVTLCREQQFAVVEVADQGEGIPAELLPRIFELYFTTKPKGSGIGLAMTYRILQLHGGALEVRSNTDAKAPDRGTVFTLRVPMVSVDSRKNVGVVASRQYP